MLKDILVYTGTLIFCIVLFFLDYREAMKNKEK